GVTYGPNIGVDLLRTRVNAVLKGEANVEDVNDDDFSEEEEYEENDNDLDEEEEKTVAKAKPKLNKELAKKFGETPDEKRSRLRKEAFKLVRVRITCMNPLKKNFQGEVFTVSNSVIGTYRKYVPYNVESDDGWLVPKIMLNMLRERKFNQIKFEKRNGVQIPKPYLVKEFAIELLDPMTQKELTELARRQAMSRSVEA